MEEQNQQEEKTYLDPDTAFKLRDFLKEFRTSYIDNLTMPADSLYNKGFTDGIDHAFTLVIALLDTRAREIDEDDVPF